MIGWFRTRTGRTPLGTYGYYPKNPIMGHFEQGSLKLLAQEEKKSSEQGVCRHLPGGTGLGGGGGGG